MRTLTPARDAALHWDRAMKLRLLTGLLMGTFMSLVMSGFVTWINTGMDAGFPARWLRAFGLAWLIAVPLATVLGPLARKWAERLAGSL